MSQLTPQMKFLRDIGYDHPFRHPSYAWDRPYRDWFWKDVIKAVLYRTGCSSLDELRALYQEAPYVVMDLIEKAEDGINEYLDS